MKNHQTCLIGFAPILEVNGAFTNGCQGCQNDHGHGHGQCYRYAHSCEYSCFTWNGVCENNSQNIKVTLDCWKWKNNNKRKKLLKRKQNVCYRCGVKSY